MNAMSAIAIARERLDSPVALGLIAALNAELSSRYREPGANHFRLDLDEVRPGRGAFVVAWRASEPVGCGAVRRLSPGVCEVKRMYVDPGARGLGIGRAVLASLEAAARQLGAARLVLETGTRQPEAIGLYLRAGFVRTPPYGEYVRSAPTSVCMAKQLTF